MRRISIAIGLATVLVTVGIVGRSPSWAQANAPVSAASGPQPKAEVLNSVYDFGTVLEGQKVVHTFTIRNNGKKDLIISGVKTSCGCTVAQPSKNRVAPGDESQVTVTFDTQFQKGHRERTITAMTNDPQSPNAIMTLQGEVRVEVDATPSEVAFNQVNRGTEQTQQVVISDLAKNPKGFQVAALSNTNPNIKVSQEPRKDGKPGAILNVTLLKSMPIGPFDDSIQVANNRKPIQVHVFGQVVGDLTLDPRQVSFGIVPSHQGVVRILRLSNRGGRELKVLGVSSTNQSVTAAVEPVKAGREFRITVELRKNTPDGQLRGTLAIRTDDPTQPSLTVPFYGIIGSFEG
jgi:uncharacterized protein DUF1573/flagellar associated PapD-like protein